MGPLDRRVHNRTDIRSPRPYDAAGQKEITMLSTLIVILLIVWLLGVSMSYTAGGLIHVLLVVAIVVVLLRVLQGRNPLRG
jgi:predicted ferric reductase